MWFRNYPRVIRHLYDNDITIIMIIAIINLDAVPSFGPAILDISLVTSCDRNIYDNDSSDWEDDPNVVYFLPPKPFSSGGDFPAHLSILVTVWPFKQSPKSYFDFFNKTYNEKKLGANNVELLYSNYTLVAGKPAAYLSTYCSNLLSLDSIC